MKTLLFFVVLFSGLTFAQSKKIFSKQELLKLNETSYFPKEANINFYLCMQKNYKVDPSKNPEFLSKKEFDKKYPNTKDTERFSVFQQNSLSYNSFAKWDYVWRLENQKQFPKCIKKSEIDW
ncbi:hypothetical protein KRE43_05525 [Elizabethkingia meningoseptica]|uniref:hypothetical protein n=1 Tax=Elizabethkingia meningoseptica TaxID=238 RepID=UPI0023B07581|nr:hypothetical protein [Elizabethkingia meningoseptica]MDE5515147.1 hypothetical protein [Elizabethkingia meningoseptica]MDE5525884.1 hypothetical protein [Elizabethkingia meningoseptica]MDE5529413.1 hypothetical protein [Elizabethkingia meningoseptica]MDE5532969.1 hypothetical protein [Elizabethkingia meningoseptica]MDE5541302.1 hypothetical protein [Elizabethkingia meningoseptica]